ncbi:MAG: phosphotransferase [Chloroflexi bacterium]|nr:phosphotransferase [Chloroflexota bacterium]
MMHQTPDYLERIRSCYPELVIGQVSFNRDGLVNDVVVVNREWVFRFPKDAAAARALMNEVKVIDLLRHHVDMPLPVFQLHDGPFVSYRFIPGEALHREDILQQDEGAQDRLAEQLGTFLYQMHAIPADRVRQAGIAASGAERTREDWLRLYMDVQRELFPLFMAHAREWVERLFTAVLDSRLSLAYDPVLVHADLGPYHVLYDAQAVRIRGVIDFGTSGLGDPAGDFANVIHGLGESFLRRMMRYHTGIAVALDRARFHAGTLELQWALQGLRSHDRSWFVCHIGRARDVWPIGAA